MRFNINLASQPYEAARRFRQRIGSLVAVLALMAVLLLGYIIYQRVHSRAINQQLSQVKQEISELNQEEAQARAILNRPENRDIADQSEFLNQLFVRKALSWTRVFAGMEKIMPYDLHVVSMKPEYTKTNDLVLHVVVATGSRDRAVELVRRIEKSNHFRQAEIVAENVTANLGDQSVGPGNIQFDIAAMYLPNTPDTEEDTGADEEKDKGSSSQKAAATGKSSAATLAPNAHEAQAQNLPRPPRENKH